MPKTKAPANEVASAAEAAAKAERAAFRERHNIRKTDAPADVYQRMLTATPPGVLEHLHGIGSHAELITRVAEVGERFGADSVTGITFATTSEIGRLLEENVKTVWAWTSRDRFEFPRPVVRMEYTGFNWSLWLFEAQVIPWMWARDRSWRDRVRRFVSGLIVEAGGDEERVTVQSIQWAEEAERALRQRRLANVTGI